MNVPENFLVATHEENHSLLKKKSEEHPIGALNDHEDIIHINCALGEIEQTKAAKRITKLAKNPQKVETEKSTFEKLFVADLEDPKKDKQQLLKFKDLALRMSKMTPKNILLENYVPVWMDCFRYPAEVGQLEAHCDCIPG